jgi:hypothetical protein
MAWLLRLAYHWLRLLAFPMRIPVLQVIELEISRFQHKERPYMPAIVPRPDRIAVLSWAISVLISCTSGGDSGSPAVAIREQIIVAPSSASVDAGGTQQFQVSRRRNDGSTGPVAVTYQSTGGTVTSAGLYTAGSMPGIYRVIATESGGALTGSATIAVVSKGAQKFATDFSLTENPISEGGRWINGGSVGLDWTNVSTTPGLAIGHQVGASYTDATALLTGTWEPDQIATATVHMVSPKDACFQEVELRLRSAITAHVITGYEISFKVSQTSEAYLIIVRWNGALGSWDFLTKTQGAQFALRNGDVVSAKIVGNVITAYLNGVQKGQVDITSIGGAVYSTGNPGMGFNLENSPAGCPGTNGNYGYTSFTAIDAR